jgi:succinate dehydrogenase / fumarate reductase cytochrome b subunit
MAEAKGLIKSHIVKKYWMALTGLFLCLFLIGHLLGNLQLFQSDYAGILQFNEYAVFMTHNPLIVTLSYITYFSIIFHAVDGLWITIANKKARKIDYTYSKPSANSPWSSRNMGILGTIILVYIVVHMQNFWYKMKFGDLPYMKSEDGSQLLNNDGEAFANATVRDGQLYVADAHVGEAMKDLYSIVIESFQNPLLVLFYVLAMVALGFHLSHGFASAFQSLGLRNNKYASITHKVGMAFAIIVPTAFAIIPIYLFLQS